ncbi:MAG: hypothetical protein OQL27_07585 [Sedimenticola sp.]|nr:hypothetical protein [Sedimenticola sp.]
MYRDKCLVISLILIYAPLVSALDKPDCSQLEAWAASGQSASGIKVSPGFELNALATDARLVPLFGRSIFDWTREDFSEFNLVMRGCSKAASKRRDRTARGQLQQATKQVGSAQRPLAGLIQARTKSDAAIAALIGGEANTDTLNLISLAEEALQGKEIRPRLRGMSRDKQQPLIDLIHSQRYLASTDIENYSSRLNEQKQVIEKAQLAAQEEANVALDLALKELQTVPATATGLTRLDELSKLQAVALAEPEKAKAYNEQVATKRSAVELELKQAQDEKSAKLMASMIEKLRDYKVNEPADLGKLWDEGVVMGKELRAQGERSRKNAMSTAFWKRFNQAVIEMLEPFKQQLQAIPDSEEGLGQLKDSVVKITGIKQQMPVMNPYHQAVQLRGAEIAEEIRQIACNKTLDAANISSSDAKEPLWGAGQASTLGNFFCQLSSQGAKVHEYDDAGLLSDTHTVKLTTKADGFHTLKLHEGEVQPGKKMLIGYELADANQQRALSVSDWERYVKVNTQRGGGSAECERLANKPRNELSMKESERLMGCLLQAIPKMMMQSQ